MKKKKKKMGDELNKENILVNKERYLIVRIENSKLDGLKIANVQKNK